MSDPTLQNLQSLIADLICAEAHDIHLHATFAELGIDSLDHAQLINECEDHFDLEIADADAVAASTVSALYDLITSAQAIAHA
jgi:acyl carrier protein